MDNENEWYRWHGIMSPRRVVSFDSAPAQTPTQPDNVQPTPTSGALEVMSDDDLKARAEAAWSYLFVYLDEIRRRAGIAVQSEEIPF